MMKFDDCCCCLPTEPVIAYNSRTRVFHGDKLIYIYINGHNQSHNPLLAHARRWVKKVDSWTYTEYRRRLPMHIIVSSKRAELATQMVHSKYKEAVTSKYVDIAISLA